MAIRLNTPEKEYFYFGARIEYLCEHLKASAGNTDMTGEVQTEPNGESATVGLCLSCAERLGKGESLDWSGPRVSESPIFSEVTEEVKSR
jgi:hypothetical protein